MKHQWQKFGRSLIWSASLLLSSSFGFMGVALADTLPEAADSATDNALESPSSPQEPSEAPLRDSLRTPPVPGLDTPTVLPGQDPTLPLPEENRLFRRENGLDADEPETADDGLEPDLTLEDVFSDESLEEPEPTVGDPDLGTLRLRQRPLATRSTQSRIPVYLLGNVGYTSNENTLASIDPVSDRLFRSSVSLVVSPRLSRRTLLIGSVQGGVNRYGDLSRLDYNELSFQASLRHVLSPRAYGDIGWTQRNLYLDSGGDRFLKEHAVFLSLTRRDPLDAKTILTSFYNLRAGFADPSSSNRLRNTLGTSLSYDMTPQWQAALTSSLTLTNFTQQDRQDFYGQALAQLSYKLSKNARLSLFGSLTRGNSSNRRVDFDGSAVGVSFNANVQLF